VQGQRVGLQLLTAEPDGGVLSLLWEVSGSWGPQRNTQRHMCRSLALSIVLCDTGQVTCPYEFQSFDPAGLQV
jgi:hypothetical protein